MTIDLKWLLPFVLPFVVLGMFRAVWWAAGAEWSDATTAAASSIVIGSTAGTLAAIFMAADGIKWTITIGRRDHG